MKTVACAHQPTPDTRHRRWRAWLCAAALALGGNSLQAQPVPTPALEALATKAAQGPVRVIIRLAVDTLPDAPLSESARQQQRQAIVRAQDSVVQLLAGTQSQVHRRYETVPMLAAQVDANALARLRASAAVKDIVEDGLMGPGMLQGIPLISG